MRSNDLDKPAQSAAPLLAWCFAGMMVNVGLTRLCYGIVVPGLRHDLALDYFASGMLNAVHLAAYLLGTLAAPWVGLRIGMPMLARSGLMLAGLGSALCMVAPVTALGTMVLGVGRLVSGLGASGAIVATMVMLFTALPSTWRASGSALAYAGMGLAVVLGGLATPWIIRSGTLGWRSVFGSSVVLGLILAVRLPAVRAVPATVPELPATATFALRSLLGPRWRNLVGGYLLFGIAYIAYATFVGASLAAANASPAFIAATWIVFGLGTMAGAGLTALLQRSDRLRRWSMAAAGAAGTVGAIAAAGGAQAALPGAALVGLTVASLPAIVSATARERCTAAEYARVFSLASMALGIGQLIGPVLAGSLVTSVNVVEFRV